jgi:hypothetical protein
MKITKSQLKQIIKEELEEGLGDMLKKMRRRHHINRAGQEEEFMNQYYIDVRDEDGGLIKRHSYRDHTDESAWEHAEKLKRELRLAGEELEIIKDTEDGEVNLGSIF